VRRDRAWALALLLACGCGPRSEEAPPPAASLPEYVGAARCAACHPAETAAWRGSHHERAMQAASEASVLGDFAGARYEHLGRLTTFSRRDGRFLVATEGADGAMREHEVAYTFGVEPLQQLLLRMPGGRLQALDVAWDSRPREAGGQRWFSLQPERRVPPGDPLHWTQLAYNWNSQCAECHSTNLRKGYDPARDVFETTWSDLSVACEACHGPGGEHAAWAERAAAGRGPGGPAQPRLANPLPRSQAGDWSFVPGEPIARLSIPRDARAELETCAPCHARRSSLREGWRAGEPLLDAFRPALLEAGLYEADGQMQDEVYVYGSFLQSRMHGAGVVCGDCHEPHALALRAEGNALCGQCHRAEVFDVPEHHHHAAGSAGAQCASCHMPARTYMGVDVRHDHSFRVPRPDLSRSLGTPNACTDCHASRPASWAADAVRRWAPGGRSGAPHYAEALAAGRRGAPDAEEVLARLASDGAQPGIARASALALLRPAGAAGRAALEAALADPDPLVRLGAVEAAARLEPAARLAAVAARLDDPRRAVRLAAASALADVPASLWPAAERSALAGALAEYRAAQAAQAERPEAHLNLGVLHATFGEREAARREYETALRLAPWFAPALVNLADLERDAGREPEAEALLRRALAVAPEVAEVRYALGLSLVRSARLAEALAEIEQAAELAPASPRYSLARALVLQELGDRSGALRVTRDHVARWPGDPAARALLAELEAARDSAPGRAQP
jgi:predicted CXXCH cytochrome family protein